MNLSSENIENEISSIFNKEFKELDNFEFIDPYQDNPTLQIESNYPPGLGYSIAHSLSHFELYEYFEDYFFKTFDLYIDKKRIDAGLSNKVKLHLISLIKDKHGNYDKKVMYHHYLKSCIYYSHDLDHNQIPKNFISQETLETINLFSEWYDFVKLLEKIKKSKKLKEKYFYYLPNETPKEFKELFIQKSMFENIGELRKRDKFLNSDIFPFKNTFGKIKTTSKMAESFYILLINVLYNGTLKSSTKDSKPIKRYILEDINFEKSNLINLLHKQLPEYIL